MKILWGDCIEQMAKLDANSVDAIVTDPPYGLSFMGKRLGFEFIGCEREKEYFEIAQKRITHWQNEVDQETIEDQAQLAMEI